MSAKHIWKDLYEVPDDSRFMELYYDTKLHLWKTCQICGAIGKLVEGNALSEVEGKVKVTVNKKHERKKADADRWSNNLNQWKRVNGNSTLSR